MITIRSITRATLLVAVAALTAQAQVGASVTAKDANTLPEAEIAALPGMTPGGRRSPPRGGCSRPWR